MKTNNRIYLESKLPSDEGLWVASFNQDEDSESLYAPTVEFMRFAFKKMNKEFFGNELPNVELIIKTSARARYMGQATYTFNRRYREITPTKIVLNGTRLLTVHGWFEVMLHEMIHILDYVQCPEHFLEMGRRYDPHGYWFLNIGSKFEKDGFHVQRYCVDNIGVNTDNKKVNNAINNTLLLKLSGGRLDNTVMSIAKRSLDWTLECLAGKRGVCNRIDVMTSQNPNIIKMHQTRLRDKYSKITYYRCTDKDKFNSTYGPFKVIDTVDLMVTEDKDEVEYDDMNHICDDYAKKIYDMVDGVVDVKEVNDNEVEVSIA